jgi:hypothetical protein
VSLKGSGDNERARPCHTWSMVKEASDGDHSKRECRMRIVQEGGVQFFLQTHVGMSVARHCQCHPRRRWVTEMVCLPLDLGRMSCSITRLISMRMDHIYTTPISNMHYHALPGPWRQAGSIHSRG